LANSQAGSTPHSNNPKTAIGIKDGFDISAAKLQEKKKKTRDETSFAVD